MSDNPELKTSTQIEVIFRDIDALGHVNNAVYFTYMETARAKFFMELLGLVEPTKLPIIVAEACCTYESPATYGEKLKVEITIPRIGNKSFDLHYQIIGQDHRSVANGSTVIVTFDYDLGRPIPIPPGLRQKLEAYQIQTG